MHEKEKENKYKIMNLGGAMRETDNKINKLFTERPSVEARLTVLSLAKKELIVEFINELEK